MKTKNKYSFLRSFKSNPPDPNLVDKKDTQTETHTDRDLDLMMNAASRAPAVRNESEKKCQSKKWGIKKKVLSKTLLVLKNVGQKMKSKKDVESKKMLGKNVEQRKIEFKKFLVR